MDQRPPGQARRWAGPVTLPGWPLRATGLFPVHVGSVNSATLVGGGPRRTLNERAGAPREPAPVSMGRSLPTGMWGQGAT